MNIASVTPRQRRLLQEGSVPLWTFRPRHHTAAGRGAWWTVDLRPVGGHLMATTQADRLRDPVASLGVVMLVPYDDDTFRAVEEVEKELRTRFGYQELPEQWVIAECTEHFAAVVNEATIPPSVPFIDVLEAQRHGWVMMDFPVFGVNHSDPFERWWVLDLRDVGGPLVAHSGRNPVVEMIRLAPFHESIEWQATHATEFLACFGFEPFPPRWVIEAASERTFR